MFTDILISLLVAYYFYRQEISDRILRELQKEVAEIKKRIPKRWTDKLFDKDAE